MFNRTSAKILIVEDEDNLGLTLKEYLHSKGYQTLLSESVAKAKSYFYEECPDIILMDIGLPDGSGLDLAREFRKSKKSFLLIFLSALNDPDTKVEGLEIGAEDYITKPFALKELNFRLEKSLQLKNELLNDPPEIAHGPLKIRFSQFQVIDAKGQVIELGQKECAILKILYSSLETPVSRDEIIQKVWGENKYPSNRTVDNYIVKLRRWCETDDNKNIEIQSIRGVGYKLCLRNSK